MLNYLLLLFPKRFENEFLYICFGLLLFVVLATLSPLELKAQLPGSLDTTFSGDGIATTNFPNVNYAYGGGGIAIQADNKIVLGGQVTRLFGNKGSADYFALVRFNADGSLDTTFGDDGHVYSMGTGGGTLYDIAIQPDGKIIAGGFLSPEGNTDFGLARYNYDGSLDTSFNGTGIVRVGFENPFNTTDILYDFALQPDGKIIAVGRVFHSPVPPNYVTDFGAMRFNADGSLDTTFDGDGKILFDLVPNLDNSAYGVAVQPDGKILIGGSVQGGQSLVVRLNPNGSLDNSFDGDGKAFISTPNASLHLGNLVLQPDNKIVVIGIKQYTTEPTNDFAAARLNPDGSLDTNFGSGGLVTTDFEGRLDAPGDALIQRNGKILLVGGSHIPGSGGNSHIAAARYLADGSPDLSFGTNGKILTNFGNNVYEYADAAALQADGKFIAGGYSSLGNFTAVRFHGDAVSRRFSAFDYDSDGKSDISVFRPSAGDWYLSLSANNQFLGTHFGTPEDLIAPADFDDDGKTDISVFRPSVGTWYRLNSADNSFSAIQYGAAGDLPVPADFDGDHKADICVYRPSAGSWYRLNSSNNQSVGTQFGLPEDKPIVGDFDGDSRADLTVYRASNGTWYRIDSSNNQFAGAQFGTAEDKPVPADYDADGKTDLAVYRPSSGHWFQINSSSGLFTATQFGISEDKPAPADYDGDGKADLTVFRPSTGTWYLLRTTAGFTGIQFGANGDLPTPNAFVR